MQPRLLALTLAASLPLAAPAGVRADSTTALAAAPNASALNLGDPAPAFTAHRLIDGAPVAGSDYAGKILVLNFWATWCPPCRAETPDMIRSYRKLGAPDVAFLGVDTTEVAPIVKTFVSAKGVPYPIALAGPETYNGFGVAYIPTTIVIDAHGIVRARWTGELDPKRLAAFVADARAGKNYALDTPDQTMIDRLLDPANYDFSGSPAQYAAVAKRVSDNIDAADAFASAHGDGKDATVDFTQVQMLEGTLELASAQRAATLATTDEQRAAADRELAAADGELNRFGDAVTELKAAQALTPGDAKLSLAIAKADYRLHDYADGIGAAKAYAAAEPEDSDGWDFVGLLNQRTGNFADAAPAYERAIALLIKAVDRAKTPDDKIDATANVADESLDLADVYMALGDAQGTARAFALANLYGDRLDPHGRYADLYNNVHERTQEGLIAVHMAHRDGKVALSVAPWTGPDLPGSVASTLKYRLIVASVPNGKVDLQAQGLRPGWVASFCADGLCSPGRVSFSLPQSGVKTYEFQLVPPGSSRAAGTVTIRSGDGTAATVPPPRASEG